VPLAGVLWVLVSAAYRNAVTPEPLPSRGWVLGRWRRRTPTPTREAVGGRPHDASS